MAAYFMTDFAQQMCKCPNCEREKIFIIRYADVATLFYLPFKMREKVAFAYCRSCKAKFEQGANEKVDVKLNQAIAEMHPPRILKMGAYLYPIVIALSILLFII